MPYQIICILGILSWFCCLLFGILWVILCLYASYVFVWTNLLAITHMELAGNSSSHWSKDAPVSLDIGGQTRSKFAHIMEGELLIGT